MDFEPAWRRQVDGTDFLCYFNYMVPMHARSVIVSLLIVAAVEALPAQASDSSSKPIIASVTIDTAKGHVLLRGFNFPTYPKVYMGREGEGMNLLQVRSSSPNTIEATLKSVSSGVHFVTVLEGGADPGVGANTPGFESPFPKSLPVNSPVFAGAMVYEIRQK